MRIGLPNFITNGYHRAFRRAPVQSYVYNDRSSCMLLLKRLSKGESFFIARRGNTEVPVLCNDQKRFKWILSKIKSALTFNSTKAEFIAKLVEANRELILTNQPKGSKDGAEMSASLLTLKDNEAMWNLKKLYSPLKVRLKPIRRELKNQVFTIINQAKEVIEREAKIKKDIETREAQFKVEREQIKVKTQAELEELRKKIKLEREQALKLFPVKRKIGENYLRNPKNHDVLIKCRDNKTVTTLGRFLTGDFAPRVAGAPLELCQDEVNRRTLEIDVSKEAVEVALEYLYAIDSFVMVNPVVLPEVLVLATSLGLPDMVAWVKAKL